MAARPFWKGYMKLSLVTCPVAMMAATSEEEKVRFHVLEPPDRQSNPQPICRRRDRQAGRRGRRGQGLRARRGRLRPAGGRGARIGRARKRPHDRHPEFRRRGEHRLDLVRHALLPDARRSDRRGGLLRHSRRDALDRDGRRLAARPQPARTGGDPEAARQRDRALDVALWRRSARSRANISPQSATSSRTRS